MAERTSYGIKAKVGFGYEEAISKVTEALKEEGFGILTEINVKQTLKDKIGADFRKYIILGACNPKLAHKVLQSERDIGVLLPCNVVVYEEDDGSVVVVGMDPSAAMSVVDNPAVKPTAEEVASRLERAIDSLAG